MQMEFTNLKGLASIVLYPDGFTKEKRYPTILLLHGAGSRGSDLNILAKNAYFQNVSKHKDFPFVTIAPQCAKNTWFDHFETLRALVEELARLPFVDASRLYLMGTSMGGYGAWQLAMSMPEAFAAMVPICGGGMAWNTERLKALPIWAFHGALDNVVPVEESIKMVEAVNQRGGYARITIYPNNYHDAWNDTYSNPSVFEWLLSHTNQTHTEGQDSFLGADRFG